MLYVTKQARLPAVSVELSPAFISIDTSQTLCPAWLDIIRPATSRQESGDRGYWKEEPHV